MITRLSTALLPLALLACGAAPGPPPRPALWKVADADTTIYLFGTIHVLPAGTRWNNKAIDTAVAQADSLVLEVAGVRDAAAQAKDFLSVASAPGLPPITERVPPDQRAALEAIAREGGVALDKLQGFKTWAAALTLAATGGKVSNATASEGVEVTLAERFAKAGKPIAGLETNAQQFAYFDSLPEDAQRTFLTGVVAERGDPTRSFDSMVAAWLKGDTARLAATAKDEAGLSPDLSQRLIHERNARWAGWVKRRLDQPGTTMVAVGAAHLAGERSVLSLLERRGVKVERVR